MHAGLHSEVSLLINNNSQKVFDFVIAKMAKEKIYPLRH
jgi:hypothetical protein